MTFADIANTACQTVGELDTASVAVAQQFAMNWYRVIFNSFAWAETTQAINILMGSTTTTGVFTVGSNNVTGITSTAGMSPGMLVTAQGIVPQGTLILTVDSPTQIHLSQNSLVTGTKGFTASAASLITPSVYGELITSAWTPDPLKLVPMPAEVREIGWIQKNVPGIQLAGITSPVPAYYWLEQTLGVPVAVIQSGSLGFLVQAALGDNCTITIHGLATDPVTLLTVEQTELLTINVVASTLVIPVNNFTQVWSCSKTSGNSRITVQANGATQYVMMPRSEEFKFNQYFFFPVPNTTWTWQLHLKMRCPDVNFLLTTDAPVIRHLEDALIAYTQACMLERQRQYSKANMKKQEAMALVEEAKNVQQQQSEHYEAITPDVYDFTNMDGRYIWRPTTSFF